MARRMFTDKIVESDAFLEMPLSSQALYFHYCMNADDDGFVKNPTRIQKMIGAATDDDRVLVAKAFVLPFESGIKVIKHWRMHNLLRKDRYNETEYIEEKSMLAIKENGAYTFDFSQGKPALATKWQPNGNQMATQYRLGKDSIELGKISLNNKIKEDDEIKNIPCVHAREEKSSSSSFDNLETDLHNFLDEFGIMLDNYDATIMEMDFTLLAERFRESEWLKKNITSFKKVCEYYPKIISGYYKNYDKKPKEDKSWDFMKKMLEEAKAKEQKEEQGEES